MFKGSLVALVTPMHEDGSVDFDALTGLVEFHVENGTDAIVAVGTTGESATLDFDEHIRVVEHIVNVAAGRIPVIAGTGANATREAIHLTREAKAAGADACLSVTPYYNKPTQEGLYRHFSAIVEAVELPLILYNVPGRTACDMLPDTVARLADHPLIIGIKEASGSLTRITELVDRFEGRFAVYSGDDSLACEAILHGAQGAVSVTANVAPAAMHAMTAAALAKDRARAKNLDAQLAGLHRELFCEANPIPVKWALAQMGLIGPTLRLPMTPLSAPCQPKLKAAMKQAGLLSD
ncbi:MAG TPA: 4-hydroxy-tetrahydrodipicolinate synthase [Halothiobacillus sp.]|nr:4-hydroxy-tetrahydrodipicolinate synthase [Halothiobacillus sp.]